MEAVARPEDIRGFGRAVRLASPHKFRSHTTREQTVADPDVLRILERNRLVSIAGWIAALVLLVWFREWAGSTIGLAMIELPSGFAGWLALVGAMLLLFMGTFAFMRLGQIALRALFGEDDPAEWPREGVDWGQQTVTLDRDGLSVALLYARREYPWESLAELTEDDVFIVSRRQGERVVIPKDPADEDELRERLFRGITLATPLR